VTAAPEPAEGIEKWIVVDIERILRLPERLRRLWPRELLPHTGDGSTGPASAKDTGPGPSASDTGSGPASASDTGPGPAGGGIAGDLAADEPSQRELDVLTAWVAGFAAELNRVHARVTVVVSSGTETVHLALCLGGDSGQAVLALQGEGFETFSGHQLLRRIDSGRIGPVVERLAGLIEHDCVLTLSWAGREAATGLEFLHRRDGRWYRPVIERRGGAVTVETETAAGEPAVRMLVAAVLTRALKTGSRR
jgi:hypothetical protein